MQSNDELSGELKAKFQEIEGLKLLIQQLKAQNQDNEQHIALIEDEKVQLKQKIQTLDMVINAQNGTITQQKEQLQFQDQLLNDSQRIVRTENANSMKEILDQQSQRIADLTENLNESLRLRFSLNAELEKSLDRNSQDAALSQKEKTALQQDILLQKQQLKEKDLKIDDLSRKIIFGDDELLRAQSLAQDLQKVIDGLHSEIQTLNKTNETKIQKIQAELAGKAQQIDQLQQQILDKHADISKTS